MLLSSKHLLEIIGNMIGKPIIIDNITLEVEKLSYARILVEVTQEEINRTEVVLESYDGTIYKRKVDFEWVLGIVSFATLLGILLTIAT